MVMHVLDIIDEVDVVCSTWFKMAIGPAASRGQTAGRMSYLRALPQKKLIRGGSAGGVPAPENGRRGPGKRARSDSSGDLTPPPPDEASIILFSVQPHLSPSVPAPWGQIMLIDFAELTSFFHLSRPRLES